MTERLFQYIWQFQYFNNRELCSTDGSTIQILFQGTLNQNQGPDFSNAKIRIGGTTWMGSVELHIKSSDWIRHDHDKDSNYKNVILHVVMIHDSIDSGLPVLELTNRVSSLLLDRYTDLMNSPSFLACGGSIKQVNELTWKSWKERLIVERLARKSALIENYLRQTNFHWEEVFWWLLARNFGYKVNADSFEAIARSIPLNLLAKHKFQIHQLEALLFGQAGLLSIEPKDDYMLLEKREFEFLKKKYKLPDISIPVFFLRMRPGNFPSIRLAQLAALIQSSSHLFSRIRDAASLPELIKSFDVSANDYWHYHYRHGELSPFKIKKLGDSMISNIVINTIAPILFTYGKYKNELSYQDRAIQWLEQTPAESNAITLGFMALDIENKSALDSQALIELKNEYCNKKRCLDCRVGAAILRRSEV